MTTFREELAWAAGFFDGEGHVGLMRRAPRGVHPFISVGQVDRRPLDRFRAAVGLGTVYGPYEKRPANHSAYFTYRATSFEDAQAVVAMLWTFLSPIKREQARAALSEVVAYRRHLDATFWNGQARRGPRGPYRPCGHVQANRGKCPSCRKAADHEYYVRNRARILARLREEYANRR